MNPPSLLQRVADGERAALEACLDTFAPLVWSAARRYLGPSPDAEDTVQEIFIELWRCADRYRPDLGSESAFIMTIARRRLLDARRRLQRRPDTTALETLDGEVSGFGRAAHEESLADDEARAWEALKGLPKDQRLLLRLSIEEGWTHQEISARLVLPLGTVKTRLRRALLRLRQAMACLAVLLYI